MILQSLTHILAPWQSLYSNSTLVSGTVTFVHIAGLLFGGGFAVAADRVTWRAFKASDKARAHALEELNQIHKPVLVGLTLLFVSGILLAAADVKTYGTSLLFWGKMGLVALLCLNGLVLQRTESALRARTDVPPTPPTQDPLWRRLRATAVVSLVLWTTIVLAGTTLVNIA